MKTIPLLVVLALLLSLSTLVACGASPSPSAPTNGTVTMGGTSCDVASITIAQGGTITFTTDQGGTAYTLVNGTNGKAAPESGAADFSGGQLVGPGKSWTSPPWNTAGTFPVTCTFHPNPMTMAVTVTS